MSRECAFCDPGELKDRIIHNDTESVVSILSNPAMVPYHSLIIPRRHIVPTEDVLTEQEIIETEFEKDRLTKIFRELGFRGIDTLQKTRPEVPEGRGGTKMDHIHTHVVASNPADELYERGFIWGDKEVFKVVNPHLIASQLSVIKQAERAIYGD